MGCLLCGMGQAPVQCIFVYDISWTFFLIVSYPACIILIGNGQTVRMNITQYDTIYPGIIGYAESVQCKYRALGGTSSHLGSHLHSHTGYLGTVEPCGPL